MAKFQPEGLRIRNVDEINQADLPLHSRIQKEPEDDVDLEPRGKFCSVNLMQLSNSLSLFAGKSDSVPEVEENREAQAAPSTSHAKAHEESYPVQDIKLEVKKEERDNDDTVSVSSTSSIPVGRPCCRFGIKCYRTQNSIHRAEEAHPGDTDYKIPQYPEPPPGTPICPFGTTCYRRNPTHFQAFSHSIRSPSKFTSL